MASIYEKAGLMPAFIRCRIRIGRFPVPILKPCFARSPIRDPGVGIARADRKLCRLGVSKTRQKIPSFLAISQRSL
jgi:hypothetical protein